MTRYRHQIDDVVTELHRPEVKDEKKDDKKDDKANGASEGLEFTKKPYLVGSTNPLFATRTGHIIWHVSWCQN